jgi:hypothetical protein
LCEVSEQPEWFALCLTHLTRRGLSAAANGTADRFGASQSASFAVSVASQAPHQLNQLFAMTLFDGHFDYPELHELLAKFDRHPDYVASVQRPTGIVPR